MQGVCMASCTQAHLKTVLGNWDPRQPGVQDPMACWCRVQVWNPASWSPRLTPLPGRSWNLALKIRPSGGIMNGLGICTVSFKFTLFSWAWQCPDQWFSSFMFLRFYSVKELESPTWGGGGAHFLAHFPKKTHRFIGFLLLSLGFVLRIEKIPGYFRNELCCCGALKE